jgi:hypothetical protein
MPLALPLVAIRASDVMKNRLPSSSRRRAASVSVGSGTGGSSLGWKL